MPGSCSSKTLNGCSSCVPDLVLFALSASTTQGMAGHFHEGKYYARFSSNFNRSFYYANVSEEDNCIGDPTKAGGSSSMKNEAIYNYMVDRFGNIVIYVTGSGSSGHTGWMAVCCAEGDPYSPYLWLSSGHDYQLKTFSAGTICDPGKTETTETCNISDPDDVGVQCAGTGCEFEPFEGDCGRFLRCKDDQSYTDQKNLQFFNSLAQSSVSQKIDILTNNESSDCHGAKCGNLQKDDCWGGGGCFTISDNNLDDPEANMTTSQKLKFKIGIEKEGFDETYKSISGKVKFYIPSEQDIEEERTPCCNDDFSGTVVKEAGYSISADLTFKNDYLASDAGDFDNNDQSHAGEAICPCYTIDSISFV